MSDLPNQPSADIDPGAASPPVDRAEKASDDVAESAPPAPAPAPPRRLGRGKGEPRDFSRMGLSHDRPEKPRFGAWAPSDGKTSAPILAALRAEGFVAQIGSRKVPVGNFEVQYLHSDADRVREIILGVDPGAIALTVGR